MEDKKNVNVCALRVLQEFLNNTKNLSVQQYAEYAEIIQEGLKEMVSERLHDLSRPILNSTTTNFENREAFKVEDAEKKKS